ncbi:hypothetical protein NPIL_548611 [Nephila pilipes]|uniref:Uncharacterized protein n=1 Tax=Nephila pilipes TaxID=299642 RepID=A0A8X6QPM0_NEPPI|nr:hypothetical protein NPIL_548611 [Nephila pilipes]
MTVRLILLNFGFHSKVATYKPNITITNASLTGAQTVITLEPCALHESGNSHVELRCVWLHGELLLANYIVAQDKFGSRSIIFRVFWCFFNGFSDPLVPSQGTLKTEFPKIST